MLISSGWLGRFAAQVRAMFWGTKVTDTGPSPSAVQPVRAVVPAVAKPRPLAAQMSVQGRLNVPAGKKPRSTRLAPAKVAVPRPKRTVVIKATPSARSVYLQARHMAAKTRPKSQSNVFVLPVAAKTAKPMAKTFAGKPQRVAA